MKERVLTPEELGRITVVGLSVNDILRLKKWFHEHHAGNMYSWLADHARAMYCWHHYRRECERLEGILFGDKWLPEPENVNALPKPVRDYIYRLETICDPAGMVREITMLRDQNEAMQRQLNEKEK